MGHRLHRGRALRRRYGRGRASHVKRFSVTRVHIDRGGYDSRGAYFGIGAPLYEVVDHESNQSLRVRAASAKAARNAAMVGSPLRWK